MKVVERTIKNSLQLLNLPSEISGKPWVSTGILESGARGEMDQSL